MLRLTKKSEYGLIALRHMLNQPDGTVTSAKEISKHYNIPAEAMAKILQVLARKGMIVSSQGARGGYILGRDAQKISLSDIIETIEGPFGIVDCMSDVDCECVQMDTCNISEPFRIIQKQFKLFLSGISLADIDNEIEMQKVIWH